MFGVIPITSSRYSDLCEGTVFRYLPISAVLVSEKVVAGVEAQASVRASSATVKYLFSASCSGSGRLADLELMEERNIIAHVREVMPLSRERVAALNRFDVGNTCSVGLIGAAEFIAEPDSRQKMDEAEICRQGQQDDSGCRYPAGAAGGRDRVLPAADHHRR